MDDNLVHSTESIQTSNLNSSDQDEYETSSAAKINENNIASSLPTRSNVLAIGYSRSMIPIRRKRQVSSGYQSTSTDFSSSLNDTMKLSSDESSSVEKQKSESITDSNDSDHYFDDDNDDEDYEINGKKSQSVQVGVVVAEEEDEEREDSEDRLNAINNVLKASTQILNPNRCCNHITAACIAEASSNQTKLERKNLLREKIMQLPVSETLKRFLLYYRKI